MSDDFTRRSNAARLDDLIAANPEDRAFVNSGAAEDFCLLRARCSRGFFHFVFLALFLVHMIPGNGKFATSSRSPLLFACGDGVRLYSAFGWSHQAPAS